MIVSLSLFFEAGFLVGTSDIAAYAILDFAMVDRSGSWPFCLSPSLRTSVAGSGVAHRSPGLEFSPRDVARS